MTVSWTRADGSSRLDPAARRTRPTWPERLPRRSWPSSRTTRPPGRLIGTVAERDVVPQAGTVSGGGKSEISKAITDAFIFGSAFVADFDTDMDAVDRDPRAATSRRRFARPRAQRHATRRPILSPRPLARHRSSSC